LLHGDGPKQTILHGDAKAANFFFRAAGGGAAGGGAAGGGAAGSGAEGGSPVGGVGLIDFQWAGAGLVATELAYLVLAAAAPESVFARAEDYAAFAQDVASPTPEAGPLERDGLNDSEEHLLRHYHEHLVGALLRARGPKVEPPDYEALRRQYRAAFLDQCRMAVASHWDVPGNRAAADGGAAAAGSPTVVQMLRARQAEGSMLYNASNKSLVHACWVLRRMRLYLADPELSR
jgi:hypothetical protein